MDEAAWTSAAAGHAARADALTAAHRERRRRGAAHPVEDFLFTYYSHPVGRLCRWHPGAGVGLAGEAARDRRSWRWHVERSGVVTLDVDAYLADRGELVDFARRLLSATAGRPAQLGCLGLHEWAMVYRQGDARRHLAWPLRLGPDGTDAVVEGHQIRCSHYDAYRFFTPDALGRNTLRPTREDQVSLEQPGCLHANMDLYKWAYKLGPIVPGDLLLDCLELARDIRAVDMRASPYDLADLGYPPIRIETPAGKVEYVAAQRAFADRADPLRRRLTDALSQTSSASARLRRPAPRGR